MFRGINQQNIFESDEDCNKFIEILKSTKITTGYEVYAYCLMGNHVHLLIKEGQKDLSNTMKRIGTAYAHWFNWQYSRKGHLFQDRFKSEAVEDDAYFLAVLRYIHQNPVKAGLVKNASDYAWSSYQDYTDGAKLVDTEFALEIFNQDRNEAMNGFIKFNNENSKDECLEIPSVIKRTISDKEIRQMVLKKYHVQLAGLQNKNSELQKEVLQYLKNLNGTSLRQLSRLSGLTVNKIFRA